MGETPSKIVAPVGQTVILREWAVLYWTVNLGGTTEAAFRPFADERFFVVIKKFGVAMIKKITYRKEVL